VTLSGSRAWVECKNGRVLLKPAYMETETLRIGDCSLELVFKEITTEQEFLATQHLARLHYRGHALCGRAAKIIVRNFHPLYPAVVGYIELATPFYMNKPRARVLDAPFREGPIGWERWDTATVRKNIHAVVRIARCVVYPEFRGVGLGKALVRHAARFAKTRWQVSQVKPLFLEISADMLRFVPFAQRAGMVYIGETEGNLARVAEDMRYLLKNVKRVRSGQVVREEAFGIVDRQVSRMNDAVRLMEHNNWNVERFLSELDRFSVRPTLTSANLLRAVLSLPKPTYALALTPRADAFLTSRVKQLAIQNGAAYTPVSVPPLESDLIVERVTVAFRSRVRRTQKTHEIEQAFGISLEGIDHPVLSGVSLVVHPGMVVLVTGPSGSGKTTFLRLLQGQIKAMGDGRLQVPTSARIGIFGPIDSSKPLIEALGAIDASSALSLMGLVGLSDAFVFFKRYDELSMGQQYRAMLAKLIASTANIWVADEFCASLDHVTANVVSASLQRLARSTGAVLVVASSNPAPYVAALQPDRVLKLTSSSESEEIPGSTFVRAVSHNLFFAAPATPPRKSPQRAR
jgi:ABC-type ATPase with predicted acetyltransferase domain